MSSGHRNHYYHSLGLERELGQHLDDPKVKAFLKRPYRVDRSHPVLYTGGSNNAGDVYFIDPDVPRSCVAYVLWHERVEKALRVCQKLDYAAAHRLATAAERMKVEQGFRKWSDYNRVIERIVQKNEHEELTTLPKDFDTGPYRESHERGMLSKIKRAQQ